MLQLNFWIVKTHEILSELMDRNESHHLKVCEKLSIGLSKYVI